MSNLRAPLIFLSTVVIVSLWCGAISYLSAQTKGDERIVRYRSQATLKFNDYEYSYTARNVEHDFDRVPGTLSFKLVVEVAYFETKWKIGDSVFVSQGTDPNEEMRAPEVDYTVTFVRNGEKTFAKFKEVGKLFEDDEISYSYEGVYEMKIVEGSWDGYENGGILKLAVADADRERLVADRTKIYQNREHLGFYAAHYKDLLSASLDRMASGQSGSDLARQAAEMKGAIDQTQITAVPSWSTTFAVYELEGDYLLASTERETERVVCRAIVPTPGSEAAPDESWRERAGLIGTPERFDPKDHRVLENPFKYMHKTGLPPHRRGEGSE